MKDDVTNLDAMLEPTATGWNPCAKLHEASPTKPSRVKFNSPLPKDAPTSKADAILPPDRHGSSRHQHHLQISTSSGSYDTASHPSDCPRSISHPRHRPSERRHSHPLQALHNANIAPPASSSTSAAVASTEWLGSTIP